jgi:hypothetical protein
MRDSSVVQDMRGSSVVKYMHGSSVVKTLNDLGHYIKAGKIYVLDKKLIGIHKNRSDMVPG